jgi:hypothetical protein
VVSILKKMSALPVRLMPPPPLELAQINALPVLSSVMSPAAVALTWLAEMVPLPLRRIAPRAAVSVAVPPLVLSVPATVRF